jgi:hypothetical protein
VIRRMSRSDVQACVDMYLCLNDESFLPADRDSALRSLNNRLINSLNLVYGDTEAWLSASRVRPEHCNFDVLQQFYFASKLSGVKAYRAVVSLHDEMYEFAVKLKIPYCISPGSHMDVDNTFTRILEKNGWMRRGHVAARFVGGPPSGTQDWPLIRPRARGRGL